MVLNLISNKNRKRIALGLFALAIIMAIPPNIEFITDLLINLPLAMFITQQTNFSLINSLVLTYTLIPLAIIYLGAWVYPSDTTKTFNGQFLKLKNFFIKYINLVKKNPLHLAWALGAIIILYRLLGIYQTQINIYIFS